MKKRLAFEGRSSYDLKAMFKLYIYGSENGLEPLRKLVKSFRVNVEVKWLNGHIKEYLRILDNTDR